MTAKFELPQSTRSIGFPDVGRSGWTLTVAMVASLFAIWATFALIVQSSFVNQQQDSSLFANDVTALLARDISRNLELYDVALKGVITNVADPRVRDLAPEVRRKILFDTSTNSSSFGAMLVIDRGGDIMEDSRSVVPRRMNLSDRDYFRVHVDNPQKGLYVTRPFQSRLTGDWVIGLSRRLNSVDGAFNGVALGTIKLSFFNDLFAAVQLPPRSTVGISYQDGTSLVRFPATKTSAEPMAGQASVIGEPDDGLQRRRDVDGSERLFAEKRIAGFPLIQSVGLSTENLFDKVRERALATGAGFFALSAIITILAMILGRELHRRNVAERTLQALAATDGLTGLLNHRRFDSVVDVECRAACANGSALSLLMIDIDHFKAFNDHYGHHPGDRALVAVSKALHSGIRSADFIARVGGEEFAIVLPQTDFGAAARIAESVRNAVELLNLPHAGSPFGIVTVSVGVACIHGAQAASGPTGLIEEADRALYRAKARGRNCTEGVCRPNVETRSSEVALQLA